MRSSRWARALAITTSLAGGSAAWAAPKPRHACDGAPGEPRCHAIIHHPFGSIAPPSPDVGFEPDDLTPTDLQTAYHIDPTLGSGVTVAVVDAFSYPTLESDLAYYRGHFHLPSCTTANGCLRIVNVDGEPSPLPTMTNDDWEAETALDVDMVSAACPLCNIVVIEVDPSDLDNGNATAAKLLVDAVSNSWGSVEIGTEGMLEPIYDHPGISTYAATGDEAYDTGGMGPEYPSTSAYVIAVGGTTLLKNLVSDTFSETAWSDAGSSCSMTIAAPSYQPPTAACAKRAASDVSADADPNTGVAVYDGGWGDVGGTSESSPLVAALMAASGHGDASPEFIYRHPEAFTDITRGSNGSCGTTLCDAGSGWDGPTGLGTPIQSVLATIGGGAGPSLTIESPADNSDQSAGFALDVVAGTGTVHVDLYVDGVKTQVAAPPFALVTPSDLKTGAHAITAIGYDIDHNSTTAKLAITVTDSGSGGGCAAGGGAPGPIAIGVALLGWVRLRRRAEIS